MEIVYKHKITGYVVSESEIKEDLKRIINIVKGQSAMKYGTNIDIEMPEIYSYVAYEIAFSSDFERIIDFADEFTTNDLNFMLFAVRSYSVKDNELFNKINKMLWNKRKVEKR